MRRSVKAGLRGLAANHRAPGLTQIWRWGPGSGGPGVAPHSLCSSLRVVTQLFSRSDWPLFVLLQTDVGSNRDVVAGKLNQVVGNTPPPLMEQERVGAGWCGTGDWAAQTE